MESHITPLTRNIRPCTPLRLTSPQRFLWPWLVIAMVFAASDLRAATARVQVGGDAPSFVPETVSIQAGDTVEWLWASNFAHSVTSGLVGAPDGLFESTTKLGPYTFSYTFTKTGTFPYYCRPHGSMGMTGTINVTAPTPSAQPLNVSTRLRVQSGQNAMIGGFIITGNVPKKVIVRAIGPSIGIAGALADPTIDLNGPGGPIASNDNWKDTQRTEIEASTIPPSNDRESAIVATLAPASYTAIVRGKNDTTGIGVVEVYDLDQAADSKLANISTRGPVEVGNDVMIGGFILGKGTTAARVIVRASGPSLSKAGLSNVLADPILDLRDANGAIVRSNDNWKDTQRTEIEQTGIPPANDLEAAIVASLSPGQYTAILSGKGSTTGLGLVELYHLQ